MLNRSIRYRLDGDQESYIVHNFHHVWFQFRTIQLWLSKCFAAIDYEIDYPRISDSYSNIRSISSLALLHFYNNIYIPFSENLRHGMLDIIRRQRIGEDIDKNIIRSMIEIFIFMSMAKTNSNIKSLKVAISSSSNLDIYISDFEIPLLQYTRNHFHIWSQVEIAANSTSIYLTMVSEMIEKEVDNSKAILIESSISKIIECILIECILNHQCPLLQYVKSLLRSFDVMQSNKKDLRIIYIYSDQLKSIDDHFIKSLMKLFLDSIMEISSYIIDERKALNIESQGNASDHSFIDRIMALNNGMDEMIHTVFADNISFHSEKKSCFRRIMADNASQTISNVSMLAYYCDRILNGAESLLVDILYKTFDHITALLECCMDKDIFCETYIDLLATRLLSKRSISTDLERDMIQRMKLVCGPSFTLKMEGMMNDLDIALDIYQEFKNLHSANPINTIEFSVILLTNNFWKPFKINNISIPNSMKAWMDVSLYLLYFISYSYIHIGIHANIIIVE